MQRGCWLFCPDATILIIRFFHSSVHRILVFIVTQQRFHRRFIKLNPCLKSLDLCNLVLKIFEFKIPNIKGLHYRVYMLHKDLIFFQSQTDGVKDEGLESGAQGSNGDYGAKLEPGESEEKGKYSNLSSRPIILIFVCLTPLAFISHTTDLLDLLVVNRREPRVRPCY